MSAAAFLVLCLRSPGRALNRARTTSFELVRRELADADPLPDPAWRTRVKAVLETHATATTDRQLLEAWAMNVAATTRGAVFSVRDEEFPYVEATEATLRTRRLLETDVAALARWIDVARAAPFTRNERRLTTFEAIDTTVRDALGVAMRADATVEHALDLDGAWRLAYALRDPRQRDGGLEETLIALAQRLPDHADAQRLACELADQHAIDRDAIAEVPTTTDQLDALLRGLVAGDPSAVRRLAKFQRYDRDALVETALAAATRRYEPASAAVPHVVAILAIERLTVTQRARLESLPQDSVLARALREGLSAHREGAGSRAAAYSQARFDEYERYRTDPLVAAPRSRDDDIAMFRGLNDALYGTERTRPMLDPRIVALICDRRFDEAREAYVAMYGETHAEAAMADAVAHFAPDLD